MHDMSDLLLDPAGDHRQGARVLTALSFDLPGILHGFSTRQPGELDFSSTCDAAQQHASVAAMAQRIGFAPERLYCCTQVHGNVVRCLQPNDTPQRISRVEADALISDQPNTAVAVRTADCVPVLLACETPRVVAAIHAGWRGLVAGVIPRTIATMVELYGCDAARLHAAVGPSIGVDTYEVSDEVAAQFDTFDGAVVRKSSQSRPHIDLKLAAAQQVRGADVHEITVASWCTFAQSDLFYSYRRNPTNRARQLSVIGIVASAQT